MVNVIGLVAALIALSLAHLLRKPHNTPRLSHLALFVLAFAVTAGLVRLGAHTAGLVRPTDYDSFIRHAALQAAAEPDAPLAVFVGASFSRNGVDDARLTRLLRAQGYPHLALNLSLQGASLQERGQALEQFVRVSGRVPDTVFLELAETFDRDPAYVFEVAKFSDRAIKQFTPDATLWSAYGLSTGACSGLAACVKSTGLLGLHAAMNWTGLGLLSAGKPASQIEPQASYDPNDVPRTPIDLETIAKRLAEAGAAAEPRRGPDWAAGFRKAQRAHLTKLGTRRIVYYYPPVLSAGARRYVADVCAGELADWPCIAPVDQVLLASLEGPVWLDEEHLLREGADTYTDWLAGRIVETGALK